MQILIIGPFSESLVGFRGPLIEEMIAHGHQVTAGGPTYDEDVVSSLRLMGAKFALIRMERVGLNPFQDVRTLFDLVQLLHSLRPDVILATSAKPIVYAALASRFTRTGRFFAMLEGLGYSFGSPTDADRTVLRFVLSWLYKTTLKHAEAVFVLNRDDPVELVRQRILTDTHKIKRLNGIGVDLSYYQAPPPSPNRLIFVMVARLVREKGVAVYVAAAEKVKLVYPQARFLLVGGTDSSRDCITHEELSEWQSRGAIEYGGRVKDVRPFYSAGSVVVLPSWYREGLPRTLLEGLAAGRAIITTDSPGCREAVEHGYNGFLVEPRSTESLVNAMMSFVRKPELISEMGRHSRELAERKFDVRAVNAEILTAMDLLGTANQASYEVRSEFGESLQ